MIVRSEQLLFDIKEGYCSKGWYKAKRFCCPQYDESEYILSRFTPFPQSQGESCTSWRSWSEVFGLVADGSKWIDFEDEVFEYIAYAILAVSTVNNLYDPATSLTSLCHSLLWPLFLHFWLSTSLPLPPSWHVKTLVSCLSLSPMQIEKGKLRQYLNLNAKFSITYVYSETEKL